ncbi:flavin reductase family protein [Motilimonas sp. KMU-193]|uniref:flavin reductase family protein n=1 Tax=Motilimonas sp. KMU-193 TaxID=3388668 RepID=UPI00396B1964
MKITAQDLAHFDQTYRTHLVNSLAGFKSANLIGTIDLQGATNLAIVSSVFHLGANPPLMGMIMRPHRVPRHTLENIQQTKCYTINHVNADIYQQAHHTSARYPKSQSEFAAASLTPQFRGQMLAPYVEQSRLQIGMELVSTQTLAVNDTELVIGKVIEIHVPESAIASDGFIDIAQLNSVAVSGLDSYHTTQSLGREPYAKPRPELST